MISILILTHNRPELFKRCLESVLLAYENSNTKYPIEILVNNDSNDIKEIDNDLVKYYYESNTDLSVLYKNLFDKAKGEFIYYLEDDDYILLNFFNEINLNFPFNFLNFKLSDIREAIIEQKKEFKIPIENTHFQLSQLFFKKNLIKSFPSGNDLHNDWKIFEQLRQNEIFLVKPITWVQTKDGKDNISDKRYNKDDRWPSNMV